jgi:hypothetical protein
VSWATADAIEGYIAILSGSFRFIGGNGKRTGAAMMGSKWRRKLPVAVSVPLSITNHETERPLTGNLLGFNEPDNLDSWPTAAPFPGHKGPTRPRVPRATLPNSSSSRQLPAYLIRPLLFVVPFLGLHLLTMYPPYNNSQPHYPENGYQQPPQPPPQQPPASNSHPARDRDPPHPSAHRLIGTPLDFSTGQFAGKHVRAELIELQKADLGRKYVPIIPPLSLSLSLSPTSSNIHSSLSFLKVRSQGSQTPRSTPGRSTQIFLLVSRH